MNKITLLIVLLLVSTLSIAQIYKSTDENGNVIFTDIAPEKDSTALDLPKLNIVETSKTRSTLSTEKTAKKTPQKDANKSLYHDLSIIQPANDETIRDNEGKVNISIHITPRLFAEKGHRLVVKMNGTIINDGTSNTIQLQNIDRGTHSITAFVENQQGKQLASAHNITFHMKRAISSN